jgi:2-polyprenyl-6-methoxyphenol hydroxylase-like FAD-dependent oxidoreductase
MLTGFAFWCCIALRWLTQQCCFLLLFYSVSLLLPALSLSAIFCNHCSPAVADAVAAAAAEALPQPLAELIASSTRCMGVAAVSDMALPCHALGRVAFVGEAGCVARPHGSSSVDKALQDASSLADTLKAAKFSVDRALHAWSLQRVPQSVALCRAAAAAGNRLQGTEEC